MSTAAEKDASTATKMGSSLRQHSILFPVLISEIRGRLSIKMVIFKCLKFGGKKDVDNQFEDYS